MRLGRILKSNQEQAVASWINYLNQVRFSQYLENVSEAFKRQDINLNEAINVIDGTFDLMKKEIIERNRGGVKGMHGFIAEVAEVGIGNARESIKGKAPIYVWINDNGPSDLWREGIEIQQKFVNSGNHLSLQAIRMHLEKYPDYLKGNNKYQIPKDHYEKIKYLLSIPKEQANKMPTSNGEFSLKQWNEVHEFFEKGDVTINDIEPSILSYQDAQANQIGDVIKAEKRSIRSEDRKIRQEIKDNALEKARPTFKEGAGVTAISAAIEGVSSFVIVICEKKREGKKLKDFDSKEWEDIAKKTGIGTFKGGIRGASIYALTNYTKTPAAVASAMCTASFGIANQAYLMRKGNITEEEFIMNSEVLCLDASISALSSVIGQTVLPIPVIGAVVGNMVGMTMYQIAKQNLNKREQSLIDKYLYEIEALDQKLDREYQEFVVLLMNEMRIYLGLLDRAFSLNSIEALDGSIELARFYGVPEESILKNMKEVDEYFLS